MPQETMYVLVNGYIIVKEKHVHIKFQEKAGCINNDNNAPLYYIQDIRKAALGLAILTMIFVFYITLKDASPRSWACQPGCYRI